MKLTRRHMNVLKALAESEAPIPWMHLPDGNGHSVGSWASDKTIDELKNESLIKIVSSPRVGYLITDAGRKALEDKP